MHDHKYLKPISKKALNLIIFHNNQHYLIVTNITKKASLPTFTLGLRIVYLLTNSGRSDCKLMEMENLNERDFKQSDG